jgi:predicted outer membrane protein
MDHQAADKQLMAYVDRKNLDKSQLETTAAGGTPTPGQTNDPKQQLENASGSDFDRQFVSTMIEEHEKAIQMVRDGRDSVTDTQLKSMLTGLLPKLERHRKMAQDLLDKHIKS